MTSEQSEVHKSIYYLYRNVEYAHYSVCTSSDGEN